MASKAALALAQVAYDAGFRGKALEDMVALGLAESGGDPNALNDKPSTGDYSVGYWQINYYAGLGPDRTKKYGPPETLRGIDPVGAEAHRNAAAAYALSGGGKNLQPWKADFNNRRYYDKLPEAQDAVASFLGGTVMPGSPGSAPGTFPNTTPGTSDVTLVADTGDHCIIKLPGVLGFEGPCLLSSSQARKIGGVALMVGGVSVAALGITLLVAATGLDKTGLGKAASAIPGPWGMAASAASGLSSQARADRHTEKQAASIDKEGQSARAQADAGNPRKGIRQQEREQRDREYEEASRARGEEPF